VGKDIIHEVCMAEAEETNNKPSWLWRSWPLCFVAEHAKQNFGAEGKGKAIAIVKLQEVYFQVDEELLVMCLGRTYPWKWTWQAK
jgi:hypothetical protein